MANANTPFGLVPVKGLSGQISTDYYYVPASYGTALFINDPVVITGTSNTVNVTTAGLHFPAGSLPEVNKTTAGTTNKSTGVIVGFLPNFDGTDKAYNPASTEAIAIVANRPEQLFEIQEETAGTPLDVNSVGLNANLVFAESGSTITGLSGAELDTSTPATTIGFQLRIVRLIDRADNAIGQHAKWLVRFNQHTEGDNTAGI